jgi:hypothetical protein
MKQHLAQLSNVQPHATAHTVARYSSRQLAEELDKAESTLRTRWFDWIAKVAPTPLLRDAQGYTELARTLFHEFANVDQADRAAWVAEAKQRYSQEWASAGVIDGELMPDEVGGTLALLQSTNLTSQAGINADLADLEAFIDQVNEAEANFTQQELEAFKLAGVKRGIVRYKVETQAEIQTVNALRQQRMGAQNEQ